MSLRLKQTISKSPTISRALSAAMACFALAGCKGEEQERLAPTDKRVRTEIAIMDGILLNCSINGCKVGVREGDELLKVETSDAHLMKVRIKNIGEEGVELETDTEDSTNRQTSTSIFIRYGEEYTLLLFEGDSTPIKIKFEKEVNLIVTVTAPDYYVNQQAPFLTETLYCERGSSCTKTVSRGSYVTNIRIADAEYAFHVIEVGYKSITIDLQIMGKTEKIGRFEVNFGTTARLGEFALYFTVKVEKGETEGEATVTIEIPKTE